MPGRDDSLCEQLFDEREPEKGICVRAVDRSDGEPIAGAVVQVDPSGARAATDRHGIALLLSLYPESVQTVTRF